MKKNNKGFSLVELIVVIAIMAILAAVAIPTFATFITRANEGADESFMNDVEYAIELAYINSDKDLKEVKVDLDTDGKTITSIGYKFNGDADYTTITKAGTYTEEMKDAQSVIDFDYKFKAKDAVEGTTDAGVTWTIDIASANNNQNPQGQTP